MKGSKLNATLDSTTNVNKTRRPSSHREESRQDLDASNYNYNECDGVDINKVIAKTDDRKEWGEQHGVPDKPTVSLSCPATFPNKEGFPEFTRAGQLGVRLNDAHHHIDTTREQKQDISRRRIGKRQRLRSLGNQPSLSSTHSARNQIMSSNWHLRSQASRSSNNSSVTDQVVTQTGVEPDLRINIDDFSDSLLSPSTHRGMDMPLQAHQTNFSSTPCNLTSTSMSKTVLEDMYPPTLLNWTIEQVQGQRRIRQTKKHPNTFVDCDPKSKLEVDILKRKEHLSNNRQAPQKLDISVDEFVESYETCPVQIHALSNLPQSKQTHSHVETVYSGVSTLSPIDTVGVSDEETIHDVVADTLCGGLDLDLDHSSLAVNDSVFIFGCYL